MAVIILLSMLKGEWVYQKQNLYIKYTALASRIILLYTGFILLLTLPRIIYVAIKAI
jgi:hypothetical protein